MRNINSILNGGTNDWYNDNSSLVDAGLNLVDKWLSKDGGNNNNNGGNNNNNGGNNNNNGGYNNKPQVIYMQNQKDDNTLLYVAIGAAALIAVALIMKD